MVKIFTLIFLLVTSLAQGATIYIDNTLGGTCSGNYSIASKNCSGSDGNAYNNVNSALGASGTNDTIYFRGGQSITINTADSRGIFLKQGQTWGTYPGDLPSKASVTVGASNDRIFQTEQITAGTIQNLIITGARKECIYVGYSSGIIVENNEITDCNANVATEIDAVSFTDCCGDGAAGSSPSFSSGNIFRNNWVHDINMFTSGAAAFDNSCFKTFGQTSNFTITDNICESAGMGIWADGNSGNPSSGRTPHTVLRNIVRNVVEYCFHLENSSWKLRNNIGHDCQTGQFYRGSASQTDIQNNTFYNFSDTCISLNQNDPSDTATSTKIENNICMSGSPNNYALTVGANSSTQASNVIRNNLIYLSGNNQGICWGQGTTFGGLGCTGGATYADSSAGISSWQGSCSGPTCSGNITGDPLFTSAAIGNFTLLPGSPAINAGVDVGLAYNGAAPDIGALESGAPGRLLVSQY